MAGRTDIRSLLQDFLGASPKEDAEKLRVAQAGRREQVGQERFAQQMGSAVDALGAGLTRSPVPRARELTAQPSATQELDEQSRQAREHAKQRIDAAGALDQVEQRAAKAQLDAQARMETSAAQEEMRRSMREALKRDGLDEASIEAMVRNPKMYEAWARGQEAQRGRSFTAGENAKSRAAAMERAKVSAQAAKERAEKKPGAAGGGAGGLSGPHERLLQTMANEMRDAEPLLQSARELRDLAAKGGDIPGVGKFDSRVPDFIASDEALNVQQKVNSIVARLLKQQSGAAVSEQEVERKMKELGLGEGRSEAAFRTGVARLSTELEDLLSRLVGQMPPEVLDEYQRRGQQYPAGVRAPARGGSAPRPPAASGGFRVEAPGSEDDAALEWARGNPGDPRAAEILRLAGE